MQRIGTSVARGAEPLITSPSPEAATLAVAVPWPGLDMAEDSGSVGSVPPSIRFSVSWRSILVSASSI